MTSWRPVSGSILRLDPSLASTQDIEKFFADRRIIARGAETAEDAYEVELVATGRRKRVATLDEKNEVVPGATLAELVEEMDTELRKLQIDLGGVIAWGDLDLGEVDVADDDLDAALRAAALADEVERLADKAECEEKAEGESAGSEGECSSAFTEQAKAGHREEKFGRKIKIEEKGQTSLGSEEETEDEPFEYNAGPILVLSDIALADMPGLAAQVKKKLSVLRMGGISAVMGEADSGNSTAVDVKTSFSVLISADPAGIDNPVVSLRRHGWRLTWNFDDVLATLPWVKENSAAKEFADTYLGAGALAHRIAYKVPGTNIEEIRAALEGDPSKAARALIAALKLPQEVGDFLNGLLEAETVPGVVVFEPRSLGSRIRTSVAYEMVGEGNSRTGLWEAYRKAFVDRPRLTEVVASVQVGVGAVIFASGLRSWKKFGGKVATVMGAATMINAGTRVLATQWLQMALQKEGLITSDFAARNGNHEGGLSPADEGVK